MSETNPQDLIKRMRVANEKESAKGKDSKVDSATLGVRLLVTPMRRQQLIFWMVLAFVVFLTILSRDLNIDKPWWLTGLPIVGLGLMICLIPATEEWEYRPWQTRARQYERHQVER